MCLISSNEYICVTKSNITFLSSFEMDDEILLKFEKFYKITTSLLPKNIFSESINPIVYIYKDINTLYDQNNMKWTDTLKYKELKIIPYMNSNYELYCLEDENIYSFSKKYSRGVLSKLSSLETENQNDWFFEGLSEYYSIESLIQDNYGLGIMYKEERYKAISEYYKENTLIIYSLLDNIQIIDFDDNENINIYSVQSYFIVDYLISKYGISKLNQFLFNLSQYNDFNKAFRKTYFLSINKFMDHFNYYLSKSINNKKKLYDFSSDNNEWKFIKPIIVDKYSSNIPFPSVDIRKVYADISDNYLYIIFTTQNNDPDIDAVYCVKIDTNGDKTADYQLGFTSSTSWLWNLTGPGGYDNENNLQYNIKHISYFGKSIKYKIPLQYFENFKSIYISLYTFADEAIMNTPTNWIEVRFRY